MPRQSTWTACGSPRKRTVSSSETNTSGRSATWSTPAIVSWSVIVTKSMPRRLASAYTCSGGVAHSGNPSARWTPSFETSEADEWQCRSARLMRPRMPCKSREFVNLALPWGERVVNAG